MRAPSSRILSNLADLYVATSSQADGGFQQNPPPIPTLANVPCSVQYQETITEYDELDRLTIKNYYWVLFGQITGLTPRDSIIWTDNVPPKTLYVVGIPPSEAGRMNAFTIRCEEKL